MGGGIPLIQPRSLNHCRQACQWSRLLFWCAAHDSQQPRSKLWVSTVCQLLDIHKTRTTPYHPLSDGMVEQYNHTLEMQLSKFADYNQKDWGVHIPMLLMAYRSAFRDTSGCTPAIHVYVSWCWGEILSYQWPNLWPARGRASHGLCSSNARVSWACA